MKKYIYVLISLAALVSLAGCKKDNEFLQEDPRTIFTVDNAFSKSSQVDAQVART